MYFIDKTNRPYRGGNSRSYDYAIVSKDLKSSDPQVRHRAEQVVEKIKHEDKPIKDMREALIKAHRENNHDEIKDIHEIVKSKRKYQNE